MEGVEKVVEMEAGARVAAMVEAVKAVAVKAVETEAAETEAAETEAAVMVVEETVEVG
jgi:hypothetical protein